MGYGTAFAWLFGGYVVFRAASWVIGTAIKLAFLIAFVSLGVLAMSSAVGLMK